MSALRLPTMALLVLAAAAATSPVAFAQTAKEGPWMARLRAVNFQSINSDGTAPAQGMAVDNKFYLAGGGSYFFSKTLALDLELSPPQEHRLTANGNTVGTITQFPLTVTLQYFLGGKKVRPYVGVGLNYTAFSGVNVPSGVSLTRSSMGLAVQAGLDVPLGDGIYANLDVKKTSLSTDVTSGGVALGSFKMDPWLLAVGVGYRF